MKALILAAGMGNRLGSLTDHQPKALVPVGGSSLINRVLSFTNHPAINEIGVVGGYHFDLLKRHLDGKNIRLFHNSNFEDGNILTIKAALDFIDDDVLVLNVDHIYPQELLDHIIGESQGICAMCDFDRELKEDDMKVKLDGSGKLEKISKQLTDFDGGYIGMTFCARTMNEIYKKGVMETYEIYGNSCCVEFVLGHLAANDMDVNICDTSGFKWLEVDTADDLKAAEEKLLKG